MSKPTLEIKVAFIIGLRPIVLNEVSQYPDLCVARAEEEFVYLDFTDDLPQIMGMRSILRAYIVSRDTRYNPHYISNHKSILGGIIVRVIDANKKNAFKSFKLICAGSGSQEIRGIAEYVQGTYGLREEEDADLKLHIIKTGDIWEVGAQMTPRPLVFRDYKVLQMRGAMDPTIAYAVNSLCNLEDADSYLNVFSGSATLLIEAAQCYPNLKKMLGFDNDKKTISLAIQNMRKAGVIRRIQLKDKDIFEKPDLGTFDAITADLPFGMSISKNEDLEKMYLCFIEYCLEALHPTGTLVAYTNKHEMLKEIISKSKFKIVKTLELKFITSINAYLHPKIFVCKLKNDG
jgi:precorrin-6B methylase 2